MPIDKVPRLEAKDYSPKDSTALFDGHALAVASADKYEADFDHIMFVSITAFMEIGLSSRFSNEVDIVEKLSARAASGKWGQAIVGLRPPCRGDDKVEMEKAFDGLAERLMADVHGIRKQVAENTL